MLLPTAPPINGGSGVSTRGSATRTGVNLTLPIPPLSGRCSVLLSPRLPSRSDVDSIELPSQRRSTAPVKGREDVGPEGADRLPGTDPFDFDKFDHLRVTCVQHPRTPSSDDRVQEVRVLIHHDGRSNQSERRSVLSLRHSDRAVSVDHAAPETRRGSKCRTGRTPRVGLARDDSMTRQICGQPSAADLSPRLEFLATSESNGFDPHSHVRASQKGEPCANLLFIPGSQREGDASRIGDGAISHEEARPVRCVGSPLVQLGFLQLLRECECIVAQLVLASLPTRLAQANRSERELTRDCHVADLQVSCDVSGRLPRQISALDLLASVGQLAWPTDVDPSLLHLGQDPRVRSPK